MLSRLASLIGIRVIRVGELPELRLETPRLCVRTFRHFEDWPRYREYHRDPEVARHLAPRSETDEQLRAQLKALPAVQAVSPRHVFLAIARRGGGRLLGHCSIHADARLLQRGFLGFVLHRDAWGEGFAPEAARAVVEHGFRTVGYREIWAGCTRDNARSRRVLEKVGLAPAAKTLTFPGEPPGAETLAYRCDAATWRAPQ